MSDATYYRGFQLAMSYELGIRTWTTTSPLFKEHKESRSALKEAIDVLFVTQQSYGITLVEKRSTFADYDVKRHPVMVRACVPDAIQIGDRFNAYLVGNRKLGMLWRGSLVSSIAKCNDPSFHAVSESMCEMQ